MNNKLILFLFSTILVLNTSKITAQEHEHAKNRSFDGTQNNLKNPKWGSAGVPFYREMPAEYDASDRNNAMNGKNRPSARAVSNTLCQEGEDTRNERQMSGMFYIWGQFLDHDMTITPGGTEAAPIALPNNETVFTQPIPFKRSLAYPGSGINSPRQQMNNNTAFIDGSMIYGSDPVRAKWLRSFSQGKLRTSKGNFLPYNTSNYEADGTLDVTAPKMDDDNGHTKKTFVAGDARAAEHAGLTCMHTLFMREHNQICDRLIRQGWTNDEDIYQRARKEVGAEIQAITYGQWLLSLGVQLNHYNGYNPNVQPDIMNTFATAAYRWHTMVEDNIIFRDNDGHGMGPSETVLTDVFFNISHVKKYDIGVILKGLSMHQQYETDVKVNAVLRNFLFGAGMGLDLVSLNIQRGRDHGLPNYNAVRQLYTGSRANKFSDITPDASLIKGFQSLYSSVNDVDLWAGLFSEPRLPGKSIGQTVHAIFKSQFEKLRDGDYYFYQNDPELLFDQARLQSTKLGDIIARNSTAGNFQDNVFFRKFGTQDGADIAPYPCNITPVFEGWTFMGKTGNSNFFKWNGGNMNYENAQSKAKTIGGYLPVIKDATRNSYIGALVGSNPIWIDNTRINGNWVYSDSTILHYTNWEAGKPTNNATDNNVLISGTGFWTNASDTVLESLMAEVPCAADCSSDATPPVFTYCPPSVSVGLGFLSYAKPVSWKQPTATDNCSAVTITQTSGYPNGAWFGLGSNAITYQASDAKGNKSYCSFVVNGYKTFTLFAQDKKYVSIEAHAEARRAVIEWITGLNYVQSDYFIVKKQNAVTQNFEDLVLVNNTNSTEEFAHFVDYDPNPNEGDNFYKVVAVLNDGTTTESEIKKVTFGKSVFANIFPNPAASDLTIDLKDYTASSVNIFLSDAKGVTVQTKQIDAGSTNLIHLDVSELVSGQYILRIASKDKRDIVRQVTVVH